MTEVHAPLKLVVLISGRGSNLKAILEAIDRGELPAVVSAVISDRVDAVGLECARVRAIDTLALDAADYPDRKAFDKALQGLVDLFHPGLVVLAGFMRLLTDDLVNHHSGRMVNIHPSLLPAFKGLNTHARALAAFREGTVKEHGASVHFVTTELDGGPVIIQARVPIKPDDTPETLAARVLKREHQIYPLAIRWFAEGRLRLQGNRVWLDEQALDEPVIADADD